jgi:hypothetical protein
MRSKFWCTCHGMGENIVLEGRVGKKRFWDKFIEPCILLIRTFCVRKHRKYLVLVTRHVIFFIFRVPEPANPVQGNIFFSPNRTVFAVYLPEALFRSESLKPHMSAGGEPVNIHSPRGCQYFLHIFSPHSDTFYDTGTFNINTYPCIYLPSFFLSQFSLFAFRFSCCFPLFYTNISLLLT